MDGPRKRMEKRYNGHSAQLSIQNDAASEECKPFKPAKIFGFSDMDLAYLHQ